LYNIFDDNKYKRGALQMNIYTLGFTKKTAQEFFSILKENNISTLVDIRLNNTSQLAGFAKGNDLKYFLKEICNINYIHDTELAPTKEILDNYKNKKISWNEYENLFNKLLIQRHIKNHLAIKYNNKYEKFCFLCSELKPNNCHRRLVVEYILNNINDIKIKHL
jgi:uncharacterized protein (DUF488 family)